MSLTIWDLPSPLVVNCQWKISVGAKCMVGCPLAGQEIDVHDEAGDTVAGGALSATPWPGTTGIYWTKLDLIAPDREGAHSWTVTLSAGFESPHTQAASSLNFVVFRSPEHSVSIKIVREQTHAPVDGAEVRIGVYRASTDEQGLARLDVPKGHYELNAWKSGYELRSRSMEVTEDLDLLLDLSPAVEPEESYWK